MSSGDAAPGEGAPDLERRKVWDLPTRLFHWALVGTVATGWYLGEFRSFTTINWHFYFGYTTAALLVFRIIWGFAGPPSARFSALVPGPRRLFAYLRRAGARRPSGEAGHNPLGALSVLAMLTALCVQVVTGLCAEDDSLFSEGPLAEYLENSTVITMTAIHHWSSRAVFALVALHVAAILFYALWKRENLVTPMLSGWKWVRRSRE